MKDEKTLPKPMEAESSDTPARVPFFAKKLEAESYRVKTSIKAGEASRKDGG